MYLKDMSKKIKEFTANIMFCIRMSWNASKFYTSARIFYRIARTVISLSLIYMSKLLIDSLAGQSSVTAPSKLSVAVLLLIILGLNILTQIITNINDYCSGIHNDILTNHINMIIMDKAADADLSSFDSPKFHDVFGAVQRDSQSLTYIVWNAIDTLSSIVTFLSAFIIICQYNVMYGVILVATSVPSTVMNQKYTRIVYKWGLDYIQQERKMGYIRSVASSREYAMEVRLFSIIDYLKDKYSIIWNNYFFARKKLIKKKSIFMTFCSFLPEICTSLFLLQIAFEIFDGKRTLGDYSLFTGMLGQLSVSLYLIINSAGNIYQDRLKIDNITQFERMQMHRMTQGNKKIDCITEIEFRNVSFIYPYTDNKVLQDVSFIAEKSNKICIVGLNGAGKSTIMKLLLRYYDPTEGNILVNGVNIKEYDIFDLRRQISSFFQNPMIYAFSLRENVKISDVNKSDENDDAIFEYLRLSGASDIIKKINGGLEGHLTRMFDETGMELSGGQSQKIALARAFYRESSVILLDEPSSALDPESEHNLFEQLKKICSNKIAIFTSHRLSNVFLADEIIVLENGKVIEKGSHQELMDNVGRYAELYHYQADKYSLKK